MKIIKKLFAGALIALFSLGAMAQDRGTKDEAVALLNSALAHVKKVGSEKAFKDFSSDKAVWTKKDLYIAAQNVDGTVLAHGANEKLIGKNLTEAKDQNGKFFIKELIATSKTGGGWVDYAWMNPVSKKIELKSSYVMPIPSSEFIILVGIYK